MAKEITVPHSSINLLTHQNSSCEDVFACLYDLSSFDSDLFRTLLKHNNREEDGFNLGSLAKKMNKDKGTVFRSLQKLVSLGFCTKRTRIMKGGGYYHVYRAADMANIEDHVNLRIKEIEASLHRIRKKFKEDIRKMVSE